MKFSRFTVYTENIQRTSIVQLFLSQPRKEDACKVKTGEKTLQENLFIRVNAVYCATDINLGLTSTLVDSSITQRKNELRKMEELALFSDKLDQNSLVVAHTNQEESK